MDLGRWAHHLALQVYFVAGSQELWPYFVCMAVYAAANFSLAWLPFVTTLLLLAFLAFVDHTALTALGSAASFSARLYLVLAAVLVCSRPTEFVAHYLAVGAAVSTTLRDLSAQHAMASTNNQQHAGPYAAADDTQQ